MDGRSFFSISIVTSRRLSEMNPLATSHHHGSNRRVCRPSEQCFPVPDNGSCRVNYKSPFTQCQMADRLKRLRTAADFFSNRKDGILLPANRSLPTMHGYGNSAMTYVPEPTGAVSANAGIRGKSYTPRVREWECIPPIGCPAHRRPTSPVPQLKKRERDCKNILSSTAGIHRWLPAANMGHPDNCPDSSRHAGVMMARWPEVTAAIPPSSPRHDMTVALGAMPPCRISSTPADDVHDCSGTSQCGVSGSFAARLHWQDARLSFSSDISGQVFLGRLAGLIATDMNVFRKEKFHDFRQHIFQKREGFFIADTEIGFL